MANIISNIALGRAVELYNRVKTGDPSTSRLVIVILASSGLVSDATLRDYASLSTLLAGASNEVTNTNYARKVIAAGDLASYSPDNTNDRADIDIPDQTWTDVASGDQWAKLVVCYHSNEAGANDANAIPISIQDFLITPDGTSIVAQVASAGFFRATQP